MYCCFGLVVGAYLRKMTAENRLPYDPCQRQFKPIVLELGFNSRHDTTREEPQMKSREFSHSAEPFIFPFRGLEEYLIFPAPDLLVSVSRSIKFVFPSDFSKTILLYSQKRNPRPIILFSQLQPGLVSVYS